jgi:hypothetical protein
MRSTHALTRVYLVFNRCVDRINLALGRLKIVFMNPSGRVNVVFSRVNVVVAKKSEVFPDTAPTRKMLAQVPRIQRVANRLLRRALLQIEMASFLAKPVK